MASFTRVPLLLLVLAGLLPLAACASSSYDRPTYDENSVNGSVAITSNPTGVEVFMETDRGEESVGTTPVTVPLEATGRYYVFWIRLGGYLDARAETRPLASDPEQTLHFELHRDPNFVPPPEHRGPIRFDEPNPAAESTAPVE